MLRIKRSCYSISNRTNLSHLVFDVTLNRLHEANGTYYEYARLNKAFLTKPAEEVFSTKPENTSSYEFMHQIQNKNAG